MHLKLIKEELKKAYLLMRTLQFLHAWIIIRFDVDWTSNLICSDLCTALLLLAQQSRLCTALLTVGSCMPAAIVLQARMQGSGEAFQLKVYDALNASKSKDLT